ncbi:hypothetical protein KM1_102060 [Entamoeba histolytica HM-3:IMSS]|uniref:Uncharacterized protein n=1 Tax=Entamoeba histolytica HM-3:IMSS TaxID=885315 RepID=M7W6Q3_ENTHI|nr:hypothetical protein KM1_102060 [Entamoeba histolytica HM-3:IMSS]
MSLTNVNNTTNPKKPKINIPTYQEKLKRDLKSRISTLNHTQNKKEVFDFIDEYFDHNKYTIQLERMKLMGSKQLVKMFSPPINVDFLNKMFNENLLSGAMYNKILQFNESHIIRKLNGLYVDQTIFDILQMNSIELMRYFDIDNNIFLKGNLKGNKMMWLPTPVCTLILNNLLGPGNWEIMERIDSIEKNGIFTIHGKLVLWLANGTHYETDGYTTKFFEQKITSSNYFNAMKSHKTWFTRLLLSQAFQCFLSINSVNAEIMENMGQTELFLDELKEKNLSIKGTDPILIEQSHHLNQNVVKEFHLLEDLSTSTMTIPNTTTTTTTTTNTNTNVFNNDKIPLKETDDSLKTISVKEINDNDNDDDFLNEIIDEIDEK